MKTLKSQTNPVYLIAGDTHHVNDDGSRGSFYRQEFWSSHDWHIDHFEAEQFESLEAVEKALKHFDPSCYALAIEM